MSVLKLSSSYNREKLTNPKQKIKMILKLKKETKRKRKRKRKDINNTKRKCEKALFAC